MKVMMDYETNEMTIKVPLGTGTPSRTGSTNVIASTRGNQLVGEWNGQPIYLQLNLLQTDRDIQTTGRDGKPITGVVQSITDSPEFGRRKPAGRETRAGAARRKMA